MSSDATSSPSVISRRNVLVGMAGCGINAVLQSPKAAEQEILERISHKHFDSLNSPGFWVAVSIRGQIVASYCLGVKNATTQVPAKITDRVVFGSISKAVSGTVVGAAVQAGLISYKSTLKDVFPELDTNRDDHLMDATVAQFMVHHSGLSNTPMSVQRDPGDCAKYHLAFLDQALQSRCASRPGEKYIYSSGTEIVAAMLTRLTGKDWNSLQRSLLYEPAKLTSFGMGWSSTDTFGHIPAPSGGFAASKEAHFSASYAASGGVMGSILDLARFGSLHAEARVRGISTINRQTFKLLHSHVEKITNENAAARGATTLSGLGGWPDGNLMHDGMWYRGDYAQLWCSPRRRTSVALYRNSHRSQGVADFGQFLEELESEIPILSYKYNGSGIVPG